MKSPTEIYKLSVTINREKKTYPIPLERDTLGYFSGLSELETFMKSAHELPSMQLYYWKNIRFRIFEAEKFHLNQSAIEMGHWIYDAAGNLYGGHDGSYDTPFIGRESSDCRFKPGDIVEFIDGPVLSIGVILDLPQDHAQVKQGQDRVREKYGIVGNTPVCPLDQSDDCYLIVIGPEIKYHAHTWVHHVFKPRYPVSRKKVKFLQHIFESNKLSYNIY